MLIYKSSKCWKAALKTKRWHTINVDALTIGSIVTDAKDRGIYYT